MTNSAVHNTGDVLKLLEGFCDSLIQIMDDDNTSTKPSATPTKTVRELLKQLQSVPPENLPRGLQQMKHIRALLAEEESIPIKDFEGFLKGRVLPWLPLPEGNLLFGDLEQQANERCNFQEEKWEDMGIPIPDKLKNLFWYVLMNLGERNTRIIENYGFEFCMIPDVSHDNHPKGWSATCEGYDEMIGKYVDPINDVWMRAGIYLIDPRCKPSLKNPLQWDNDFLMESVVKQVSYLSKNKVDFKGNRFIDPNRCVSVANLFCDVLRAHNCWINGVRSERFQELLVLNQLAEHFDWPRKEDDKTGTSVWLCDNIKNMTVHDHLYFCLPNRIRIGSKSRIETHDVGYEDVSFRFITPIIYM